MTSCCWYGPQADRIGPERKVHPATIATRRTTEDQLYSTLFSNNHGTTSSNLLLRTEYRKLFRFSRWLREIMNSTKSRGHLKSKEGLPGLSNVVPFLGSRTDVVNQNTILNPKRDTLEGPGARKPNIQGLPLDLQDDRMPRLSHVLPAGVLVADTSCSTRLSKQDRCASWHHGVPNCTTPPHGSPLPELI